jgi:hypothetical protein
MLVLEIIVGGLALLVLGSWIVRVAVELLTAFALRQASVTRRESREITRASLKDESTGAMRQRPRVRIGAGRLAERR